MKAEVAVLSLTNGFALIDFADLERVHSVGPWNSVQIHNVKYAFCPITRSHRVSLHRFILQPPRHLIVDHINGDGLDNRRSNLRMVTDVENQRNRAGAMRNSKSGHRGVTWDKSSRKWRATIRDRGRLIHLGFHQEITAAISARAQAELSLWTDPNDHHRALLAPITQETKS